MKSLSTFIRENLSDTKQLDQYLTVINVAESLGYNVNEGMFSDFMKKHGFDMTEETKKQLLQKSKAWRITLSDEELDTLLKLGKADKFQGGFKVKGGKIVYVTLNELMQSDIMIPAHYMSGW
jgi:hypothetical protein